MNERIGDWMQTFSGRAVYPLDLREEDIALIDIAHSLSMQCRYNGHSTQFYSIAEHSVHIAKALMADFNDPELAMAGLMHDASESYLTDIARPVKPFLSNYKEFEEQAEATIVKKYKLIKMTDPRVKEYDNRILVDEKSVLMVRPPKEWSIPAMGIGIVIHAWSPLEAKNEFLACFVELDDLRKSHAA